MTTVSASTLARRAAKTKNKAEAKRLRAESARLRREERGAKKPRPAAKQPIEDFEKALAAEINQAMFGDNAASVDSMPLMPGAEQPGRGEIVGGYLAHKANELAKIARKKGGVDAIQAQLRMLEAEARHQAACDANARVQKVAQEANERWRENIVTGFMARMAGLERMHRNGLPDAIVVDGVTLARVCDALAAAGYSATGKL